MTQERFYELVYAWKDGDLTGDELYRRVFVQPIQELREQMLLQFGEFMRYGEDEESRSSLSIGYDDSGMPNSVSLEIFGRTHSEFTFHSTLKLCGSCFGRISDSVFSDLKSLDDLINKMGTTKDGYKISGVGKPDNFKSRMKYFKEFLKKELPEFTEEDILKFDKHFQKFRKIYEWYGAEYFLTAMEYEARNNYR